jgi:hypothetical protein
MFAFQEIVHKSLHVVQIVEQFRVVELPFSLILLGNQKEYPAKGIGGTIDHEHQLCKMRRMYFFQRMTPFQAVMAKDNMQIAVCLWFSVNGW